MSRRGVVISISGIFLIAIFGIAIFGLIKSGQFLPSASESTTESPEGFRINLKAGENGNVISSPFYSTQIIGLETRDKVYSYKDSRWEEIEAAAMLPGQAYLVKADMDKTIYLKGMPTGKMLLPLTAGENYFGQPRLEPVKLGDLKISFKENGSYFNKTFMQAVSEGALKELFVYDLAKQKYKSVDINKDTALYPFKGYKIIVSRDLAIGFN